MSDISDVKKLPSEWAADIGVDIRDPDGWRRDNKNWFQTLSYDDFCERMAMSTIIIIDQDKFNAWNAR